MAVNNEQKQQSQTVEYVDLAHKTLLNSDALYKYILETSVFPREHPCLKELREMTEKHPKSLMAVPADEGQLISMLVKLMNANKTMEIGVYTGLPMIEKAGVLHKIDFREGYALHLLDELLQDENNKGTFDFVFVDADKNNYINYHKRVIDLVKVGGLIGYDNTLWSGSVAAPPDAPMIDIIRNLRDYVIELNKYLAQDSRIEICQLSVGDGITICRRID
ncbi:hypothetical protein RYX36_025716 [Vicia faba]